LKAEKENMSDPNQKTIVSTDSRKLKSVGLLGKKGLLIALSPNLFGVSCVVDKPAIIVGRHKECDLALNDPLLSRKHCAVTADANGDFFLEDLNSTNSTFLNAKKLMEKTRLHYGDRIILGNTILRFYIEEEIERK
jgi:pSer/pThr/pTyr-binding forkhead associated (FHA) protein